MFFGITEVPWWRHQIKTFSAFLAVCAGNSPVPGEFPAQRPVPRSFDVLFDLSLIKRLSKHSRGWWFETLSRPLWRHRNASLGYTWLHMWWLSGGEGIVNWAGSRWGLHWFILVQLFLEFTHFQLYDINGAPQIYNCPSVVTAARGVVIVMGWIVFENDGQGWDGKPRVDCRTQWASEVTNQYWGYMCLASAWGGG